MTGSLRSFLDRRIAAEYYQVGKRDLLPSRGRSVEVFLDCFKLSQHLRQFSRLVDLPVLLRRETNARAVRSTAFIRAAEG